jgi:hypothetical protein
MFSECKASITIGITEAAESITARYSRSDDVECGFDDWSRIGLTDGSHLQAFRPPAHSM